MHLYLAINILLTYWRSIPDGRTGFRIVSGEAIFLAFVVPDELQHWAKMALPQGCGLEGIVQQIQETSDHIGAISSSKHRKAATYHNKLGLGNHLILNPPPGAGVIARGQSAPSA